MSDETKTTDLSHIEGPLNQAAKILSSQNGRDLSWSRTIQVSGNASGIRVSEELVVIEKSIALEGNPIELIENVFEVCRDFDTRKDRARAKALQEAEEEATYWIKFLERNASRSRYQNFVERTVKEERSDV